jgi:hypothetical protein
MPQQIIPTRAHAEEIRRLLSFGLVSGVGEPIPGKMCVEAAVCFALGIPHSDNPPCVGAEVRKFKIGLNDKSWTTPTARAEGMKELAIAQLGSDTIDQKEFRDLLWFRFGTQIQPLMWRYLATKENKKVRLELADKMEKSETLEECKAHAPGYAYTYGYVYAHAHGYAYTYAHGYDYGYDYGYGYGYTYAHGYGYGYDVWFSKVSAVGVSVLRELNSPGVAFL